MTQIQQANTLTDLKQAYRNLAKTWHPDLGGDNQMMVRLNQAYQARKQYLSNQYQSFQNIRIGDILYVNGTEAVVILVTKTKFVARARRKTKQAWFDKQTGKGIDYPFYQASFSKFYV